MPSENKISEFHQYQKFEQALSIISAGLECIIEKVERCKNNPENSSTLNVSEHIFSISTIPSFRNIENKHNIHRGKVCMKNVCESLREHAMKIINFK